MIIVGAHFSNLNEIALEKLKIKYNCFSSWVFSENIDELKSQILKMGIDDVVIEFVVDKNGRDAYFEIKFKSKKNLREFLEIENNIRQFLNFLSPLEVYATQLKGYNNGEFDIYIPFTTFYDPFNENKFKEVFIHPRRFLFDFKAVKDDFSKILERWFELRKGMRVAIDACNAAEDKNMPMEYKFLTHVFALERYHQIKCEQKVFDKEISENDKEMARNKSLKMKILDLINYLGLFVIKLNVNKFSSKVRDTRAKLVNAMSSLGIDELNDLNTKLKIIFKALILKDLGFNDGRIIEISMNFKEIIDSKLYICII